MVINQWSRFPRDASCSGLLRLSDCRARAKPWLFLLTLTGPM